MNQKKQKGGFVGNLLGILRSDLLGNILAGTGLVRSGDGVIGAGQGTNRASQDF